MRAYPNEHDDDDTGGACRVHHEPPGEPAATQPGIPARRSFLDAVLGFGFVSSLLAIVYPVSRYLIPPPTTQAQTTEAVLGDVDTIPLNSGRLFRFGSRPALLIRAPSGDLRAFIAICTHLDCTVQYRADTSHIWCPCHDGVFDLTGHVFSGPPPRPLERLTVNLRGDPGNEEIVVTRA